jgi:hypothetical protein
MHETQWGMTREQKEITIGCKEFQIVPNSVRSINA